MNGKQDVHQICGVANLNIWINGQDICTYCSLHGLDKLSLQFWIWCEGGHIKLYDRIFVEMLQKSWVRCYLVWFKQWPAIAWLIIISIQHVSGHGLTKAATTCDTAKTAFCIQRAVDIGYQLCLVDIVSIDSLLKTSISLIYECGHYEGLKLQKL